MSRRIARSVAAALGTGMAVSLAAAPAVNAAGPGASAENPFRMVEFGAGIDVALEARDMKGNKIIIDEETGFSYGGDPTGSYAGGKIGTGKKDPAVCGTFSDDTCSVTYANK